MEAPCVKMGSNLSLLPQGLTPEKHRFQNFELRLIADCERNKPSEEVPLIALCVFTHGQACSRQRRNVVINCGNQIWPSPMERFADVRKV